MEIQALSPEVIQDTTSTATATATATAIPADQIDSTFNSTCIDLITSSLPTSTILALSDEYFAPASNLLNPRPPVFKPGLFVETGKWYDGWETRRHNSEEYDWVVVRLGVVRGRVGGVEIDTAFFDGNHAEGVVVQGCCEIGGGGGGREEEEEADKRIVGKGYSGWKTLLPYQKCGPARRQAWTVGNGGEEQVTHVRLCMYPDGGIARFRLYGQVIPVFPSTTSTSVQQQQEVELSSVVMGGMVLAASGEHFGSRGANLLLPGRGVDMGDGWETKRSRTRGHRDWVVVRLGARGRVARVVVDTAFYRGNFPREVRVEGCDCGEGEVGVGMGMGGQMVEAEDERWSEVVGVQRLGPDREHVYEGEELKNVEGAAYTHLKMTIFPDGGVKRFRVFGTRVV
ncbi:MAG: hypothetical protein L6R37_007429 [Teloschistes peruensis]|nr:MAG: hypothetical protein L6R37_007429 [Teloschistes peruensis]